MEYLIMSGMDCAYSIIFAVFVLLFTFPPVEVVSSGLTLENLFSFALGSEQMDFIAYHIRRCTLTIILHSLLPLLYYLTMCYISESVQFLVFHSIFWRVLFQVGILLPCFFVSLSFYWMWDNWNSHPIAKNIFIRSGIDSRNNWKIVAASINDEMLSFDKFVSGLLPSKKLIITSNWLVKTNLYTIDVAHQTDVSLSVESSVLYPINTNRSSDGDFVENISSSGYGFNEVQYLDIAVTGIRRKVLYFRFSVNSNEYEDIKGKVTASLRHAQGVVVQQTLGEKFVVAFKHVVSQNPVPPSIRISQYQSNEFCIGCSQATANVQLIRSCIDENGVSIVENLTSATECGNCFCRPMWCVECMGRWFASRQLVAQKDPGVWMGQQATCPTCRALFCILDVVVLPITDTQT